MSPGFGRSKMRLGLPRVSSTSSIAVTFNAALCHQAVGITRQSLNTSNVLCVIMGGGRGACFR